MEDLRNMKYLECCIKEALRLYPSVPIVGREVHTTFTLSEYLTTAAPVRFESLNVRGVLGVRGLTKAWRARKPRFTVLSLRVYTYLEAG